MLLKTGGENMIPSLNIPIPLLVSLLIWSMFWKGIGLWKAGRNNQLIWFIVMFLVNSVGILPIIYLVWFQKNKGIIILPKKIKRSKKAVKKKSKK